MSSTDSNDKASAFDEQLIKDIDTFGWYVIKIGGSDYLPGFAYTVGLWKNYKHPELICFGLSLPTLHAVLNTGGEMVKSGEQLQSSKTYDDFFNNGPAQFLQVDQKNIPDYFGYARWFNNYSEFPALQLVWTDTKNKFPWEEDYENRFKAKQPLLDRNAAFKFNEKETLAVFTAKQWVEGTAILHVVHDHNGDWQFLTGDQMPDDIRVVSLKSMVDNDCTLNGLFNLDYGERAERETPNAPWIRSTFDEDA